MVFRPEGGENASVTVQGITMPTLTELVDRIDRELPRPMPGTVEPSADILISMERGAKLMSLIESERSGI
jgi:hypothetical protein